MMTHPTVDEMELVPLPIVWQRLVSQHGETCDRCEATRLELERAVTALEPGLRPLGILPQLEFHELDQATFAADPGQSNRIWVAGVPLEEWVAGTVGHSRCRSVCGESQCRTVQVGAESFEVIPAWMIVKVALLASAELVQEATQLGAR